MPFRNVPAGQFDVQTLELMQNAFDAVCRQHGIDSGDPRRERLATSIVELATEGERERLAERAAATVIVLGRPRRAKGNLKWI
jgi:hypothetical protein